MRELNQSQWQHLCQRAHASVRRRCRAGKQQDHTTEKRRRADRCRQQRLQHARPLRDTRERGLRAAYQHRHMLALAHQFKRQQRHDRCREWNQIVHRSIRQQRHQRLLRGEQRFERQHHQRLEHAESTWHMTQHTYRLRQHEHPKERQEFDRASVWQQHEQHQTRDAPVQQRQCDLRDGQSNRRHRKFPAGHTNRCAGASRCPERVDAAQNQQQSTGRSCQRIRKMQQLQRPFRLDQQRHTTHRDDADSERRTHERRRTRHLLGGQSPRTPETDAHGVPRQQRKAESLTDAVRQRRRQQHPRRVDARADVSQREQIVAGEQQVRDDGDHQRGDDLRRRECLQCLHQAAIARARQFLT